MLSQIEISSPSTGTKPRRAHRWLRACVTQGQGAAPAEPCWKHSQPFLQGLSHQKQENWAKTRVRGPQVGDVISGRHRSLGRNVEEASVGSETSYSSLLVNPGAIFCCPVGTEEVSGQSPWSYAELCLTLS